MPEAEGRPSYMLALLHSARADLSEHPLGAGHAVSECISLACLHCLHAAVDAARLSCQLGSCRVAQHEGCQKP